MDDINLNDWLNRKQITLDECLLLSMEENPDNPDINQDYDETKYIELRDKAEYWILISKELQAIGEINNGSQEFKNINPLSFFKLARLNGWFLPKPVNDFLDMHQNKPEPQAEAVGDAGVGSQCDTKPKNKADTKTPRTRTDNLSRAIDAAIKSIGKKPSLDELWQYFQDDKDETGFIEDYTDEKITWRDTKGSMKDTQKLSLANRLSRVNS
jgi:hypothetical protein